MSLIPTTIGPYQSGLETDKKPFLLMDSAFQDLANVYCWRERIKKREGIKLIGRLRRVLTGENFASTTPAANTWSIASIFTEVGITGEATAMIEPGSLVISIAAPDTATFTDNGDGTFSTTGLGTTAGSGVNYSVGSLVLGFSGVLTGGATVTVSFNYFPGLPVMGIKIRELAAVNVEDAIFFDTKYAYTHNGDDFIEMGSTTPTTWDGTDASFFWTSNYRGATGSSRLFFATNFVNSAANAIRYHDGATWTPFAPLITATDTMYQAKLIIPYYGRLVAFNTWEGTTAGSYAGAENYFNRCRFSQIGDPVTAGQNPWRSDIFGKGGFIDAPTNEAIVSAQFYKNTLIVFFERSTWNLQYVGEYGLPFVWERISGDFGSESKLSTVLFDEGVLAVGDKGIVASAANDVQRIDNQIPDAVFNFHNEEGGKERIGGVRDFQKEIVYWCYSDGTLRKKFPNRVLLYNYKNNTWATYRDNVTAFGQFTSPIGISWDTDTSWDEEVEWDTFFQGEFPAIVSGNHQGYIHYYQYPADMETTADSNVDMIENESIPIQDITRSLTDSLILTIPNHNLEFGDIVYMTGLMFIDTTTGTALTTSLNNNFYRILVVDDDNVQLATWYFPGLMYINTSGNTLGYTPAANSGAYAGGGELTLLPRVQIRTKDFNPYQGDGNQMMLSYIDFQVDATPTTAMSIDLSVNSSPGVIGNMIVGNKQSANTLSITGNITNLTQTDPVVMTSPNHSLKTGQSIVIQNAQGMTQINGMTSTVTFVDLNTVRLDDIDATGFSAYTQAGTWFTVLMTEPYTLGSQYAWHRFYANVYGQYVTVFITNNEEQMNTIQTHQQAFELNAMQLWSRKAGRIV